MSFAFNEEHTVSKTFLRTHSEPSLQTHSAKGRDEDSELHDSVPQLFPIPDITEQIAGKLDPLDSFAALAICIDPLGTDREIPQVHSTLKNGLTAFRKQVGGFYFKWHNNLYGFIIPGKNASEAETIARQIKADGITDRLETISIGISQFPLMDDSRRHALSNACKALNHAAFFGPGSIVIFDAVSLNISGDLFYQANNLDGAVNEFRAALRLSPDNINVHNSLGVCLAEMDDCENAAKSFKETLCLDPNEAMAAYNLGVLALLESDHDKALARFQQAYAQDNQTAEIPFQIGKLLTDQKKYDAAIPYLKSSIILNENSATAHSLFGRCLASTGKAQQAIQSYKKAVKLNPSDAAALSALGSLYDNRGENPDLCLMFCRQSVALSPQDGLFRLRLARLYHKHNYLEEALIEYEAATELGCNSKKQITEIQEQIDTATSDSKQCCA